VHTKRTFSLTLLCLAALCGAPLALAQNADDFHRFEAAAGYSHARVGSSFESETAFEPGLPPDTLTYCTPASEEAFGPNFSRFFCERRGFNGFDASVTFNLTRYVGIKGNFSAHFRSDNFVDTFELGPGDTLTINVDTTERLYQLLGGVQIKDNSKEKRVKPYAHALAGVARQSVRFLGTFSIPDAGFDARARETSFSLKVGGGIDVRLGRRVDLRLFEFNYNPVFAGDRPLTGPGIDVPITINGRTAHNFTFGAGVVFH
jgi:opacity protein-like surface antigen